MVRALSYARRTAAESAPPVAPGAGAAAAVVVGRAAALGVVGWAGCETAAGVAAAAAGVAVAAAGVAVAGRATLVGAAGCETAAGVAVAAGAAEGAAAAAATAGAATAAAAAAVTAGAGVASRFGAVSATGSFSGFGAASALPGCSMRRKRLSKSRYISRCRFCAFSRLLFNTSSCPRSRLMSALSVSIWFINSMTLRLFASGWTGRAGSCADTTEGTSTSVAIPRTAAPSARRQSTPLEKEPRGGKERSLDMRIIRSTRIARSTRGQKFSARYCEESMPM